ncbi:MAG: hypothetical protein AAB838_00715 [Patescibacteria group bacterium]
MKFFPGSKESLKVAKQLRKVSGEEVRGNYSAEPFSSRLSCQIAIETWMHHKQFDLADLAKKFAERKGWV